MHDKSPIYLDHAAATPVDEAVLAAMLPFFTEQFYNPSTVYLAGKATHQALEEARAQIAFWIGARPSELTFIAGATEANNLAILGVAQRWPDAKVLASSIEHESVLEPVMSLRNHALIPVDDRGIIDLSALKDAIDDTTVLVSIMAANNEIGTVQPLSEVAAIVAQARIDRLQRGIEMPLYLHTDASQAANYLDIHVNQLGVDLMTLNGAKTYGPKQSAVLYAQAKVEFTPLILGGGQELTKRSGTENVASAVGLAAAITIAQESRRQEFVRLHELRNYLTDQLTVVRPDIMIHGHRKHCLANIVSFSVPGLDAERAVMMLDELDIQCGTGAACSASKDKPSHVILALGHDEGVANSTLRFSMGRATTKAQIDEVLAALSKILTSPHVWRAV